MQGNLRDLSLGEMLQFLSMGRRNGTLTIQVGSEKHHLYFLNGKIVTVDGEPIGVIKVLGEANIVTPLNVKQALHQVVPGKRDLGEIMVTNGMVSASAWQRFIQREIERLVLSLFTLDDAPFAFRRSSESDLPPYSVDLPVDRAILHGSSWSETWQAIQPPIPSVQTLYMPSSPLRLLLEEQLSEHQRLVLTHFHRHSTVHLMSVAAGLSLIDGARAMSGLLALGHIRQAPAMAMR